MRGSEPTPPRLLGSAVNSWVGGHAVGNTVVTDKASEGLRAMVATGALWVRRPSPPPE